MDNIISPAGSQSGIAQRAKEARLAVNLSQQGLAERSGVSLGSVKRFEQQGEISLKSLVKIAFALGLEEGLEGLFRQGARGSLDKILARKEARKRQRGHRS